MQVTKFLSMLLINLLNEHHNIAICIFRNFKN